MAPARPPTCTSPTTSSAPRSPPPAAAHRGVTWTSQCTRLDQAAAQARRGARAAPAA
eukprot:SM008914S23662  [mRNA]  locus=s8914:26:552:- [translate_table: standard]